MTDDEIKAVASECARDILAHQKAMKKDTASRMLAEQTLLQAENASLRAAGDTLAAAAQGGLADIRDRSPVRPPLAAALADWAVARATRPQGDSDE